MKNLRQIIAIVYLVSAVHLGPVWADGGGGKGSIRGKTDERELQPLFQPAGRGNGPSDKARAVFDYWTPTRIANAVPRDLLIDKQTGRAYIKDFGTVQKSSGKPRIVYALKEYGNNGKNGNRDLLENNTHTERNLFIPSDFDAMAPADGETIGASSSFVVTITDSVQSAKAYIQYPSGAVTSFDMSRTGNTNKWEVTLTGFTDGDWTWWAWAKFRSSKGTSNKINFTVSTGSGGGGGGTCSSITDCNFDTSNAEDFCHYEHQTIKNAEYVGGRLLYTMPDGDFICSGTVMKDDTDGRSIVLTAAHCVYDDSNKVFATNVIFTPDQDDGQPDTVNGVCVDDPFGHWTMQFGAVHVNWANQVFPANTPYDYGFYVVEDGPSTYCTGYESKGHVLDAAVTVSENSEPWTIADTTLNPEGLPARSFGYPGSVRPCFSSCFDPEIETKEGDLWLPNCEMGGGSSGGAWAINFVASSTTSQAIISVNSWGYSNLPGMGGAYLNSDDAKSVFELAKTALLTGGGDCAGGICPTTNAPATCNYKNRKACQNNGCCWAGTCGAC